MADYFVKEESLVSIANAIREKTGETAELSFPADFILRINDLANNSSEEIPSNGKDWVQSNISNITFNDVHGNGILWIACSNNGLYYSEDGKTWSQTNITNGVFYRTNYANNTWVASGEENLYYSTDGINWNSSNYYSSTTSDQNIEYHNGYWGYLNYDMSEFYFSSDGISWETEGGAYPSTVYYNEDLGKWVGFEHVSTFRTNVYTSPHGGGWTSEGTIMGSDVIDFNIFYNANGITVASSSISYTDSALWYSIDGLNFEQCTLPIGIMINKIFYTNGLWVALTGNDEGIFYSTDGITWIQSPMNTGSFTSIYYENFMWIAGSTNGTYYSEDGINWTQSTGLSSAVKDIYNDGTVWVAATENTGLYYSESSPIADAGPSIDTCTVNLNISIGGRGAMTHIYYTTVDSSGIITTKSIEISESGSHSQSITVICGTIVDVESVAYPSLTEGVNLETAWQTSFAIGLLLTAPAGETASGTITISTSPEPDAYL